MIVLVLQSSPHSTTWNGHIFPLGTNSCSGTNSPEYRSVNTNRSRITSALKSNPTASKTLKQKFKEESWLEPTDDPDEDALVTLILNRIKHDVNQFQKFIHMLRDIAGMDQIENMLKSKNMHFSFLASGGVWEEMSIGMREEVTKVMWISCLVRKAIPKKEKDACMHVYIRRVNLLMSYVMLWMILSLPGSVAGQN